MSETRNVLACHLRGAAASTFCVRDVSHRSCGVDGALCNRQPCRAFLTSALCAASDGSRCVMDVPR